MDQSKTLIAHNVPVDTDVTMTATCQAASAIISYPTASAMDMILKDSSTSDVEKQAETLFLKPSQTLLLDSLPEMENPPSISLSNSQSDMPTEQINAVSSESNGNINANASPLLAPMIPAPKRRGRPRMTPEAKMAAKTARETAKAVAKTVDNEMKSTKKKIGKKKHVEKIERPEKIEKEKKRGRPKKSSVQDLEWDGGSTGPTDGGSVKSRIGNASKVRETGSTAEGILQKMFATRPSHKRQIKVRDDIGQLMNEMSQRNANGGGSGTYDNSDSDSIKDDDYVYGMSDEDERDFVIGRSDNDDDENEDEDEDEDEDVENENVEGKGEDEGSLSKNRTNPYWFGVEGEWDIADEDEQSEEEVEGKGLTEKRINSWLTKWKEEDPEVCCICMDNTTNDGNLFVYCDNVECEVCVHQDCYGIRSLPEPDEPWYCDRCRARFDHPHEVVSCVLCPSLRGAFRRLSPADKSNGWVHIVCVLWTPEATVKNQEDVSGIEVKGIAQRNWTMNCSVCGPDKSGQGACVQCDAGGCRKGLHVTCAQAYGLLEAVEEDPEMADPYFVYCKQHGAGVDGAEPRLNRWERWIMRKERFLEEERKRQARLRVKAVASERRKFRGALESSKNIILDDVSIGSAIGAFGFREEVEDRYWQVSKATADAITQLRQLVARYGAEAHALEIQKPKLVSSIDEIERRIEEARKEREQLQQHWNNFRVGLMRLYRAVDKDVASYSTKEISVENVIQLFADLKNDPLDSRWNNIVTSAWNTLDIKTLNDSNGVAGLLRIGDESTSASPVPDIPSIRGRGGGRGRGRGRGRRSGRGSSGRESGGGSGQRSGRGRGRGRGRSRSRGRGRGRSRGRGRGQGHTSSSTIGDQNGKRKPDISSEEEIGTRHSRSKRLRLSLDNLREDRPKDSPKKANILKRKISSIIDKPSTADIQQSPKFLSALSQAPSSESADLADATVIKDTLLSPISWRVPLPPKLCTICRETMKPGLVSIEEVTSASEGLANAPMDNQFPTTTPTTRKRLPKNPNNFITCGDCGKDFHLGCLNPPIKGYPRRGYVWRCEDCDAIEKDVREEP